MLRIPGNVLAGTCEDLAATQIESVTHPPRQYRALAAEPTVSGRGRAEIRPRNVALYEQGSDTGGFVVTSPHCVVRFEC